MDPITQGLLGSTVAQAFYGEKLGKKALFYGGIAGMFPDVDVFAANFGWMVKLQHHRGITHSFFFSFFFALLLGYIVWKYYNLKMIRRGKDPIAEHDTSPPALLNPGASEALICWFGLFFLSLATHPLLDLFTPFGTQLFLPFSNHRFTLNAVAVIDPFYTVVLFLSVVIGLLVGIKRPQFSSKTAQTALLVTTCYLFFGLWVNHAAIKEVETKLHLKGIVAQEIGSYPTILQPFLRRIVVRYDDSIKFGYISMWNPHPITWTTEKLENSILIKKLLESTEGEVFSWFAMNQILCKVYKSEDKLLTPPPQAIKAIHRIVEIYDLRYGYRSLPGRGIWFIRGEFDIVGNLIGEVQYHRRPLPEKITIVEIIKGMYKASINGF